VSPTNWAGNVTFGAARVLRPGTVAQLRELVAGSTRARALGSGHSFSRIADTTGDLLSLDDLPRAVWIDEERQAVTVGAAIRYGELTARLHQAGYALPNLASLPHICVAGACATGTHGSGDDNGCLATAVSALEMVTADGELVAVSRDSAGDDFPGLVVALGALGVVTSMTLTIEPAFTVRQWVYDNLPRSQLDAHFAEIFASAYSVSVFTDWRPPYACRVWVKHKVDSADSLTPPPGSPTARCIPYLGWILATPPSSWACRARRTSGFRTSGPNTRRAAATSSSRSTWCRVSSRCGHSPRLTRSPSRSLRCCG
jgi:xylitol oxidase